MLYSTGRALVIVEGGRGSDLSSPNARLRLYTRLAQVHIWAALQSVRALRPWVRLAARPREALPARRAAQLSCMKAGPSFAPLSCVSTDRVERLARFGRLSLSLRFEGCERKHLENSDWLGALQQLHAQPTHSALLRFAFHFDVWFVRLTRNLLAQAHIIDTS
jgi:hypothetical protein